MVVWHTKKTAGVVSVAAGVYCLHYEHNVKEYGACPILMLVGEAETGNVGTCTCELDIYMPTLITGSQQQQRHRFSLWSGSQWLFDEDKKNQ